MYTLLVTYEDGTHYKAFGTLDALFQELVDLALYVERWTVWDNRGRKVAEGYGV